MTFTKQKSLWFIFLLNFATSSAIYGLLVYFANQDAEKAFDAWPFLIQVLGFGVLMGIVQVAYQVYRRRKQAE